MSRGTKLIKKSLVVRTVAYDGESCMPGLIVPDSFQEMLVSCQASALALWIFWRKWSPSPLSHFHLERDHRNGIFLKI